MKEERTGDHLLNLVELSKEQSLNKDTAFVRDGSASPELTVFLSTKQQLTDIERFFLQMLNIFQYLALTPRSMLENTF